MSTKRMPRVMKTLIAAIVRKPSSRTELPGTGIAVADRRNVHEPRESTSACSRERRRVSSWRCLMMSMMRSPPV